LRSESAEEYRSHTAATVVAGDPKFSDEQAAAVAEVRISQLAREYLDLQLQSYASDTLAEAAGDVLCLAAVVLRSP
jgi:hypothetical protein